MARDQAYQEGYVEKSPEDLYNDDLKRYEQYIEAKMGLDEEM